MVVGGDLIEFRENGRFRTMLDPLLVTLPLAWLAQAVQRRWFATGAAAEPVDDVPENDEGPAPPERDQASVDSGSSGTELADRLV